MYLIIQFIFSYFENKKLLIREMFGHKLIKSICSLLQDGVSIGGRIIPVRLGYCIADYLAANEFLNISQSFQLKSFECRFCNFSPANGFVDINEKFDPVKMKETIMTKSTERFPFPELLPYIEHPCLLFPPDGNTLCYVEKHFNL